MGRVRSRPQLTVTRWATPPNATQEYRGKSSQDAQPPLTPRRQPVVQAQILVVQGLLCGNSEKVPYYNEKGPGVQWKSWPKCRYCFSCLKVRGGSLPSKKWWTPAHSTNQKSCSTGFALWECCRKSVAAQGNRPRRPGEKWPKYRYCLSCLWVRARVRGGSLLLQTAAETAAQ